MPKRKHPHKGKAPPRHPPGRTAGQGPGDRPRSPLTHGRYFVFGHHAVAAALANPNRDVYRLVVAGDLPEAVGKALGGRKLQAQPVDSQQLERLLPPGAVHQGLGLEVAPLDPLDLEDACQRLPKQANRVVMLDQVTDPHNVGAILRSAAAFGVKAVVTTDRHAPPETGTLAKAASGALDLVPLVRVTNLAQALDRLADLGYWRIGLSDRAEADLDSLNMGQDVVLALGAEGAGLRRLSAERCDILARLPTHPMMPSLNVSNAAAVALYELARPRR